MRSLLYKCVANLLGSISMETKKLILHLLLTLQASLGRHFLISTHGEKIKAAGDYYYDPGYTDYAGDCWEPSNSPSGNCEDSSRKFLTSNFFFLYKICLK